MKRPIESDYNSHVTYARALEKYTDQLERSRQEFEFSRYSIDQDPAGIRAAVSNAVIGALAFGAQGTNPPPEGHWLATFWQMARAERELPAIDSSVAVGNLIYALNTWKATTPFTAPPAFDALVAACRALVASVTPEQPPVQKPSDLSTMPGQADAQESNELPPCWYIEYARHGAITMRQDEADKALANGAVRVTAYSHAAPMHEPVAAAKKDAVLEASIEFIGVLTGMQPPPIEVAPPEVFKPFRDFAEKICSIFSTPQPAKQEPVCWVCAGTGVKFDDANAETPCPNCAKQPAPVQEPVVCTKCGASLGTLHLATGDNNCPFGQRVRHSDCTPQSAQHSCYCPNCEALGRELAELKALAAPAQELVQDAAWEARQKANADYAIACATNALEAARAFYTQPQPTIGQAPIYQLQKADGSWIDQEKKSYDYNMKHRNATVRVVFASPQPTPVQEPDAIVTSLTSFPDGVPRSGLDRELPLMAGVYLSPPAHQTQDVQGWKRVPIALTDGMKHAASINGFDLATLEALWHYLLAVAPSHPTQESNDDHTTGR